MFDYENFFPEGMLGHYDTQSEEFAKMVKKMN
jgi:hypothetical protein